MDESTCALNQCLEILEDSFNKFEIKLKEVEVKFKKELQESLDPINNEQTKDLFDNASKTSSGYDDEESIVDEAEDADVDSSVISEDGDYDDIWKSEDCVSLDDEAYIDEKTSTSYTHKGQKIRFLDIPKVLPLYPPSEEIKIAKNSNFSTKALRDNHNEIIKTFLTDSKINQDNIHSVYKMLVEMEDITLMLEYLPMTQKDVMLNCTAVAREYWISLKDCPNFDEVVAPFMDEAVLVPKASSAISEIVPLKYTIDILLPHKHESHFCNHLYRRRIATVREITKDRAYFRFSKMENFSSDELASLLTTKYDVIFRPRRYPLRYQYHALELLAERKEIREYLFPKANPNSDLIIQPKLKLSLFNATISSNPEQFEAVQYIVEGCNLNAPFVIFGPPGTGKTTITVESILQLRLHYPRSRILVTAGSNSACDTIALRICKYFNTNPELKIRKPIIRIYSKSITKKGINLIDSELLQYSNIDNGEHYNPSVEEIRQYGIIIATLCTVGKLVTYDVGKFNFFTHIFMDEAGASTEPEALVGIMGIKSHTKCHLILSGDHKQLGPILKSERAAQLGLKKSLMERLINSNCYAMDENLNYDRTLQARLKRNYRSHPQIVRLYNHLYYNNELIAEANEEDVNMAANWCELPNSKFPIIFQAVHGVTEKDNISPSSFNNLEVQVLIWFIKRLLSDGINGRKVNQTDIGVITPYKLQNKLIQSHLNRRGWQHVESGSVETFQGREKQVIIVSLVRSFSGLGFVGDSKRLNVILSRPKSLLILIGNPLTLRRHSDFAFIMDECKRHGTFLRKKKTRKHNKKPNPIL